MEKDFDSWNKQKKEIHYKISNYPRLFINEREVWWCSLGLNIGDEQDGKNEKFERPVLVLKKFNNSIVLGLPLTSKNKNHKYYYCFYVKTIFFVAILSQLRLLSTSRFTRKMVKVDNNTFVNIKEAIKRNIF